VSRIYGRSGREKWKSPSIVGREEGRMVTDRREFVNCHLKHSMSKKKKGCWELESERGKRSGVFVHSMMGEHGKNNQKSKKNSQLKQTKGRKRKEKDMGKGLFCLRGNLMAAGANKLGEHDRNSMNPLRPKGNRG